MKKTSYLLALLSCLSTVAQAQWQSFTTANSGLHGNVVREVATDENGHLWVATQTAVQKYDGNTWTTYTQTNGLDYAFIKCLAVRNGVVWVGHDRGLSRFDGNAWTNFTNAADLPVGLFGANDRAINDVVIGANGTIWLAGSRGLGRYDGSTWTKYNRNNSGLNEEAITALALDERASAPVVWIGTNCNSPQGGVYALNTASSSWRYFNLAGRNCVHGLAVNNTGTVFVGTCNASGLTTIDSGTGFQGTVTSSGCVALGGVANDAANEGQVWAAVEPMGPAATPRGLLAYNGTGITQQFNVGNSPLPSANVTTVVSQRVGNTLRVWVGTVDQGLSSYTSVINTQRHQVQLASLALRPNPATETVLIDAAESGAQLAVFDQAGRQVHAQTIPLAAFTLDVRSWPAGLYHVRLTHGSHTRTGRLLKQ